jgi:hypothetical protein
MSTEPSKPLPFGRHSQAWERGKKYGAVLGGAPYGRRSKLPQK